MDKLNVETIAATCHDANRRYALATDDTEVLPPWEELSDEQKQVSIRGVEFRINNPDGSPADSHESWRQGLLADGWQYGEELDKDNKVHNLLVDYDQLPEADRVKDALFVGIVDSMKPYLGTQVSAENEGDPAVQEEAVEETRNGIVIKSNGTAEQDALADALSAIEENGQGEGAGDQTSELPNVSEDHEELRAPKDEGCVAGAV